MFDKTYELPLVKTYVAHWGLLEAVRELVQNALDSDSPFIYEFDREDDGLYTLILTSEFSSLSATSLLLGATTKATDEEKIGSFGEGYKIALLVLTRLGFPTQIINGDKIWTPSFQWSRKFEAELLTIRETVGSTRNKGLKFLVSGLDEALCEDIRSISLKMQRNLGQVIETSYGQILLDRPGKLYVGSLFVTETKTACGYNVNPAHMRLERDRKTVDTWDLNYIARAMWYATEDFETISKMIVAKAPEMEGARYDAPQMVKMAVASWFQENYPNKVVAANEEELRDAISKGMTKYVRVSDDVDSMVRSVTVTTPVAPRKSPTDVLQEWWGSAKYMKHQDRERAFKQLVETSRRWRSV